MMQYVAKIQDSLLQLKKATLLSTNFVAAKLAFMSRRNKLEKFAELLTFPNVYQNYDPRNPCLKYVGGDIVQRKGQWRVAHFRNNADLVLELACGGGEYSLALAAQHPDQNFIGVDIKGNRIWKGARKAIANQLVHVAFLRTRIEQIDLFFAPEEVNEIWITFPDPFLRKSKANRRLTSTAFLDRYQRILKRGGTIHLKQIRQSSMHLVWKLWMSKMPMRSKFLQKILCPATSNS